MKIKSNHIYIGLSVCGVVALGIGIYLTMDKVSFDSKTNRLLQTLEPKFRKKVVKLLVLARKKGIELRVISGERNCSLQNKLYAKGRYPSTGKVVTNAKCGQSAHNYKIAVDVVEFKNGQALWENPNWGIIGQIGVDLGLEWGGNWKRFVDNPHFQDLGNHTIANLYKKYLQTGELKTV